MAGYDSVVPTTDKSTLSQWTDSFLNLMAGFGVYGRDKSVSQKWNLNLLTPRDLELAYRSDWIARKIVTIPASDSVRAWRTWEASQKDARKIKETEKTFGYQFKLQLALEKSRLYGGSAIIIGVDQGKFDEELEVDKIGKGDLKFIHVVERWMLAAGPRVRDITSPWFGEPTYYQRSNVATPDPPGGVKNVGLPTMGYSPGESIFIHPSRVVRLIGHEYPDMESAPDAWGDSVLQPVADALKDAGLVTSSVASMIAEAKVDIVHIPGLLNMLSTQVGANTVNKRFADANVSKSVINALLLDKDEEWERTELHLSNFDKVLQMYLMICSGAADIPSTRLLGREPSGQNSTGESDMRNYYDRLSSEQVVKLTPALSRLDEVLIRSTFDTRNPDLIYHWEPLWQLSGPEQADMTLKKAQAFQIDVSSNLIDPEILARGRIAQLVQDQVYPGLASDDDEAIGDIEMLAKERKAGIQAMKKPMPGQPGGGGPPGSGAQPGGDKPGGGGKKETSAPNQK